MTNPTNSFVRLAPDSPVERSVESTLHTGKPRVHLIQHELLTAAPYRYTLEEASAAQSSRS